MWYAGALIAAAAVVVEIAVPGANVYHTGWFNVLFAALTLIVVWKAIPAFAKASGVRAQAAVIAVAFGAALCGLTGVAFGLLAPDARQIVGAPGARVRVDDLGGTLDFPLIASTAAGADTAQPVILNRAGRADFEVGPRARDAGSFVLHTTDRRVAYVEARDARGGSLTITQPTGSAFLSPVLLMQQRQTIAGMDLPYDSFAVPAAHRIVKAVMFDARQAAALHEMGGIEIPAVLFAVDDDNDRPLPHAIALAPDGQTANVGGLTLRAVVLGYPAVEVVAVPQLTAAVAGSLLVIAGIVAGFMFTAGRRQQHQQPKGA